MVQAVKTGSNLRGRSERWSTMLGVGFVKEDPVMAGDRPESAVPVFGSIPGTGGSFLSAQGAGLVICRDTTSSFTSRRMLPHQLLAFSVKSLTNADWYCL